EHGPRDGDPLTLPTREVDAFFPRKSVVAIREGGNDVVRVGRPGGGHDLLVAGGDPSVTDVVPDGAAEEVHLLRHQRDLLVEAPHGDGLEVIAFDGDDARHRVVEAVDEINQGGLSG